jgi:chemotaxis protein MotB
MKLKHIAIFIVSSLFLVSCVSSKKLKEEKAKNAKLDSALMYQKKLTQDCGDSARIYAAMINSLRDRLNDQKTVNQDMVNHLKDLSVLSGSQASSINKFLESMGAKDAYIKDLQSAMARKDSMNMALVMNLKGAIGDMNDKDINIKIDKGVVYVDISDKMLFKSGKYEVNTQAKEVLGKVAKVLLAHPEIEFMVEGHTDSVAFKEGLLVDNWDLSTKRATSVIRILQNEYGIPPARMTAAGRGQYKPLLSNETEDGRAANRRTRIVILPALDQFFDLLEKPKQ